MPGITAVYEPNNRSVNEAGDTERAARQKYIADRWAYYDGNHFKWLKKDPGASRDDNITLNLCGRSTDKAVEFINVPESFDIPGKEAAKPGVEAVAAPEEIELDNLYTRYQREVPEIMLSNLVSGHTFLKLHYDEQNMPCMTLLDPQFINVFWDAMNIKRVLFYRLQWKSGDTQYRQDIVPDWLMETREDTVDRYQVPTKWVIIDYTQRQGASDWRTTGQDLWEYEFAPIVDWPYKKRPHQYYGVSFLHNSIALNDGVNFVASNIARILKHHAHPKTFLFGAELPDAQSAVGGFWDGMDKEAHIENVELQSDLASSMNFMDMLTGEFFANQRVLDQSRIKDQVGALTNFGVRMLFSDQLQMTDEARTVAGMGLGETLRRLLIMTTEKPAERPVAKWNDPLPTNRLELLQGAKIESELGTTSMETIAESIDRDYKAEQEKKKAEGSNSSNTLGDIITRLNQRTGGFTQPQQRLPIAL